MTSGVVTSSAKYMLDRINTLPKCLSKINSTKILMVQVYMSDLIKC